MDRRATEGTGFGARMEAEAGGGGAVGAIMAADVFVFGELELEPELEGVERVVGGSSPEVLRRGGCCWRVREGSGRWGSVKEGEGSGEVF